MDSINHSLCNDVLRRPPGMTEEECRDLHIMRDRAENRVLSFWQPDEKELRRLNAGLPIFLSVCGVTHPPLHLGVLLFDDGAEEPERSGIEMIAAERQRQIDRLGKTAEHDDDYIVGELPSAAICYAIAGDCLANGKVMMGEDYVCTPENLMENFQSLEFNGVNWPWDWKDFKISPDPIRNLVKAGALIAAEIDRLKRQAKSDQVQEPEAPRL